MQRPLERFVTDPDRDRVQTLLFATMPPRYYADTAEHWARVGVGGVMLHGVMSDWSDDIWALPGGGREVGAAHPLFVECARMNERCRAVGIRHNSVKVAFYRPVPDWFDDDGWTRLCESFRQCAIFARDAGFAGVALDIEYIAWMYDLSWEGYQSEGYPRDRLRSQARRRGAELVAAMLREFPDMINWHLPEGIYHYGPLATDLLVGMVDVLARHRAPGGIHVCTEATYTRTDPVWMVRFCRWLDGEIGAACDGAGREYWSSKGTIAPGLWPLGYYRDVLDETGKLVGYTGKEETFHGALVGSYADKSENYSPAEFRRQFAAARMVARAYVWVYCHGSVLWRMTPEERARYGGSQSDVLPVAEDLDAYLDVLRARPVYDDPAFAGVALAVRRRQPVDLLAGTGTPRRWYHMGPFPNPDGGLDTVYPLELGIDLRATYEGPTEPLRWRAAAMADDGFVNLRRLIARADHVLAYSVTWVESPTPRRAFIRFGSDDSAKIWIGDRLVHAVDRVRGAVPDEDVVAVDLPAGRAAILVKCGNYTGSWGFYFRITDEEGNELPDLRWVEPSGA